LKSTSIDEFRILTHYMGFFNGFQIIGKRSVTPIADQKTPTTD
jgi:hypothetical protein